MRWLQRWFHFDSTADTLMSSTSQWCTTSVPADPLATVTITHLLIYLRSAYRYEKNSTTFIAVNCKKKTLKSHSIYRQCKLMGNNALGLPCTCNESNGRRLTNNNRKMSMMDHTSHKSPGYTPVKPTVVFVMCYRESQCRTAVPHCCKGDAASQREMAILGVSELRNPWTDRLKIWHRWLRQWVDLVCRGS